MLENSRMTQTDQEIAGSARFFRSLLGLICSLIAGYRMSGGQHRSWLHILGFTVLTVVIAYVMLDVEFPRAGLIRLESGDQLMVNLRESMK